jgi:hypothetical protein
MSNPGEQLTWQPGMATLHGKLTPRATATSPDTKTAIELLGPPHAIKQVSVVGQCVDEASARQAAAYMVMTIKLILPTWPGAQGWLTQAFRNVRTREQAITMQGWKLRMTWLSDTSTVTLQATH